jgi:UDP-N-acetylmuramate dehydrogenase
LRSANTEATVPLYLPDFNLQAHNTLAVPARARYFVSVSTGEELREALAFVKMEKLPLLALGGGSNLILRADFPGVVVHINLLGKTLVREDSEYVWLRVAAGENWHQLVEHCLKRHYWGLENLSLIPGSVGAAPIQNIGAYGVELESVFEELQALEVSSGNSLSFDRDACEFGYRDSVFKHRLRDSCIITSVILKLHKVPKFTLEYPALRAALADVSPAEITPQMVSDAVCRVRRSKLPDPHDLPNVGSFFKNPIISREQLLALQQRFPDIVSYPVNEGQAKLAAGWLIDKAGWRGHIGASGVAVHSQQALVITNPERAPGSAVLALAEAIQASVLREYGVRLEPEPRIYP